MYCATFSKFIWYGPQIENHWTCISGWIAYPSSSLCEYFLQLRFDKNERAKGLRFTNLLRAKVKIQVRILKCVYVLSCVRHFATPWTVICQASLSMEFPRQEYWSGLPYPPPGDLPEPGIEPISLCVFCIGRWILHHWATWEAPNQLYFNIK